MVWDREEQWPQCLKLCAFLRIPSASRPTRRSPGPGGCSPSAEGDRPQGRALPPASPPASWAWMPICAAGACARFWGTVPRAKERGKIAPKHQMEAYSLLPLLPCSPTSQSPSIRRLLLLLLLILQGDIPVEVFCFVGGCREIVLVFRDFFGGDCVACFQLSIIWEGSGWEWGGVGA